MLRNEMLSLPTNWEAILEQMMLTQPADAKRERVYICSPCRSDSAKGMLRNMKAARIYTFYAYIHFSGVPLAPHAYLPILLSDRDADERALALSLGLRFIENCGKLFVCGDRLSLGMYGEIEEAAKRRIPVLVFNWQVYEGVQAFFAHEGITAGAAQFDDIGMHPALMWGADKLAPFWEEDHDA